MTCLESLLYLNIRRQANESNITKWVKGTITAVKIYSHYTSVFDEDPVENLKTGQGLEQIHLIEVQAFHFYHRPQKEVDHLVPAAFSSPLQAEQGQKVLMDCDRM